MLLYMQVSHAKQGHVTQLLRQWLYKRSAQIRGLNIEDWRVFGLDSDYEEIYYITLEERGTSLCIS